MMGSLTTMKMMSEEYFENVVAATSILFRITYTLLHSWGSVLKSKYVRSRGLVCWASSSCQCLGNRFASSTKQLAASTHVADEEKRKVRDLKMSVVYIPQSKLGVSEPPPGNLSYPLAVVLNMTSYYP